MPEYSVVNCTLHEHGEAILAIFNHAIVNTTALYDYQKRTMEDMAKWFEVKRAGNYPVIGLVGEAGELLGFASYGEFRSRPAYKYTVEHSIYVRHDQRGKGLGKELLRLIVAAAEAQGRHAVIGVIDAENTGSIGLHEKAGFKRVGTMPQIGFKFGRWLDTVFYQLTLPTPQNPTDG
jgi:L-amino acid N-acyltransferase